MTQDYTVNSFQSGHVAQIDMANIEKNLECLRSFFSGGTAPSNLLAGHMWFDTTDDLPKIRNSANDAWLAILTGTADQKIWIYRNDTDDGWVIDSSVTDRVIAVKGGSGAYNVNGGNTAGETWANLKAHTHDVDHSHDHVHKWYNNKGSTEDDETYNSSGVLTNINNGTTKTTSQDHILRSSGTTTPLADSWTSEDTTVSSISNSGAQSTSDVRPAAAVGTLQYPDV